MSHWIGRQASSPRLHRWSVQGVSMERTDLVTLHEVLLCGSAPVVLDRSTPVCYKRFR